MSAPQTPETGPAAHITRMRRELKASDQQAAQTHALAAIAEALNAEPEPIDVEASRATRHDPHADHIVLSIGGKARDIPVTVTDTLGLTSYRFELNLGALGHQIVMLDLFHREDAP